MSHYAKVVKRLSKSQKREASFQAEMFGIEIGYAFVELFKNKISGEYSAEFLNGFENNPDNAETSADVVRCPDCNAIQVCYGQYGDPEIEICVCRECNKEYETEKF